MSNYAENLSLNNKGIWIAKGHDDLKYLESDETNWLLVEQQSFWYRHRNQCFIEFLKRFPPKGILFEIGAGNGSVSLAIQNANIDISIVAIEPTVKWAYNAKRRGVFNVVCSKLENAEFKKEALHNVGIFDVLEHILDDFKFLSRIRNSMPVGGRIYCASPAYKCLWSREDEAAEHIRRYTISEMQEKFQNAGFYVEYTTYYFKILVTPIFLLRAFPSRLGLRSARSHKSSLKEHVIQPGLVAFMLNLLLNMEIKHFSNGKRFKYGANCFLIAKAI